MSSSDIVGEIGAELGRLIEQRDELDLTIRALQRTIQHLMANNYEAQVRKRQVRNDQTSEG